MGDYTQTALGSAIQRRRSDRRMTQEELGAAAGYLSGAGVSISRIENGAMRPSEGKLKEIARVLGTTPEELLEEAGQEERERTMNSLPHREEERLVEEKPETPDSDGALYANFDRTPFVTAERPTLGRETPGQGSVRQRAARVQAEVDRRKDRIQKLGTAFNESHDRARDEFLLKFVALAHDLEGAPEVDSSALQDDDDAVAAADAKTKAQTRQRLVSSRIASMLAAGVGGGVVGAGVGGAAAYGTFMAALSFGTASTGVAISSLSGIAAYNAAMAALGGGALAAGGAGIAGGTLVLATIVAAPALLLSAGGLVWVAKRNRKQQEELKAKVAEAEAALDATRPGFEALVRLLPLATSTLEYIAVHAGHALTRWERHLGNPPHDWNAMTDEDQRQYQEFIDIAGAQIAVATIDFNSLATPGKGQQDLINLADEILTHARSTVEARV